MYKKSRPSGSRPAIRGARHYGGQNQRSRSNKKYIDPSKFVKAAKPTVQTEYKPQHSFDDFKIDDLLKRNITRRGFKFPSPIQDQAIPEGLKGRDIVGLANTGTGKTAAFSIPMLNRLLHEPKSKAIVIAPTRELAQQIESECRLLSGGLNVYSALLIGGASMVKQLATLQRQPRLVIGTPGRIRDHIGRESIDLSSFNIVVLDEVDRMVDMGFINDIRFILGKTSEQRQSFFFSATLEDSLKNLVHSFLKEPVTISVITGETSENVDQDVVRYDSHEDKISKLHDALIEDEIQKTLIFESTKRGVERLSRELAARGFKVDSIHGGKTQSQRSRALTKFKKNEINVLVATDVAARGIDVADITHVINYTTPNTYEDYVHRIGRTGRAGKTGKALTFVGHE